ncbi:MAG TPA: hypothetical protein DDY59_12285 [Lachnospiraceae bacterium]|jgi:Flp pilus assembly protein TadB|nr:hypothetical protein [Lachnospiraceae bacterium]HCM12629.1 hypothetical protein [Lachnospiraceae bacterium]
MQKIEFLNILRQSLEGEIDPNEIEQNIRYYDQYIGNRPAEEEEKILKELGDPRLIAKSIIEADRAAKQKEKANDDYTYQNAYYGYQNQESGDNNNPRKGFKWYHKLALAASILCIIIIISVLGSIMFRILFTIGFPILIIVFLLLLFRKK